jgi:peptidyl-prolyl cis-trans isomerase SurA
LKEGQISNVIKTKFGLHILQMVSRAGDDAIIRHILKIPPVTNDEIQESMERLDTIRAKLIAGTMKFGEAVNKYSEDEGSKFSGGRKMGRDGSTAVAIDQLDKDLVLSLEKMKVGEFSKPLSFTDERGRKAVRIIYLQSRSEPHRMNLKDDYSKIASIALEEKKQAAMEKWFRTHIPNFYISIDKEYAQCGSVQDWISNAVVNN